MIPVYYAYINNEHELRENLNDREGQPVYTYSSHLVDNSARYIYTNKGPL